MTLLYFWVGAAVIAQSTQLHFKQFTTEDGLPSSETYVVFEDQAGYIWIGTDNGVARYDGYEFEVFDSNDGLGDVVVFTILEDHTGKIWVGTFSGDAYYFEGGRFHAYKHNKVMQSARLGNEFVYLIDVRETGEVVFRLQNSGVVFVNNYGETSPIKMSNPEDFFYYTPECSGILAGRLAPIKRSFPIEAIKTWDNSSVEAHIIFGNNTCTREVVALNMFIDSGSFWNFPFVTSFKKDANEKIIIAQHQEIYIHEEGKPLSVFSLNKFPLHFVLPESDEKLWLGLGNGGGLEYVTLDSMNRLEELENYLNGRTISFLTKDRYGGLWASTTDAGVFYCPFPEQNKYLLNKEIRPISVAATTKDDFYAGYEDGAIFQYFGKDRTGIEIELTDVIVNAYRRAEYMFFDTVLNRLFSTAVIIDHSQDLVNATTNPVIRAYKEGKKGINSARDMNTSSTIGTRKLLLANGQQFGIFDLDSLKTNYVNERNKMFNGIYSFWISPDDEYLLGTINGLKQYDPNHPDLPLKSINFDAEELNTRIVHIKEYKGGVLFTTRGEGLIYLKDGKSQVVKEEDGLASDMIRDIEITTIGEVWVATLTGLSKVDFDGEVPEVRTYRTEHGLISNEVYDINIFRGVIWLATSSGIQRFLEPSPVVFSPSPTIRQMLVDGDTLMLTEEINIGPGEQNVELFFSTINFAIGDQINYRYQLEEGGPWRNTNQRKVNFPKLGPGDYSFAVSSQNEDKVWSEPAKISFTIATPWYQTWWAWSIGLFLLVSLISFYFLRRERIRRREQSLLLQINKLEHEALHAQMNPHFVFNALNSIQNFVLHNDAKQAATYLSRFALVIRQTLRSSVKGEHSLKEEVEMLKTYLLLEKLRFKEGFDYKIIVAPSLKQDQIMLPPLMIQPFVENAIIHGLSMLETKGQISVSFKGSSQALEVEIEDNGVGFDTSNPPDEESYGMEITRKRLAVMKNKKHKVSHMQVKPLYAEDGTLRGTKVSLLIYLEQG